MTDGPRTFRSLLPLPMPALAGIASEVAAQLADLHAAGLAHGALSADAIFVEAGTVRLAHRAHDTEATVADDVAALGRIVANALVASTTSDAYPLHPDADAAGRLARLAADARRAALGSSPTTAAEMAAAFVAAVDGAHVPSVTELAAPPPATIRRGDVPPGLRLAAWIVIPMAVVLVLLRFDPGLSAPPVFDGPRAMGRWLEQRDAASAFASILRLLVLVLGSYVALTTAIGVALRVAASTNTTVSKLADALLLPPVRRGVHALVGAGLAAGAFTVGAGAAEPAPPVVMRQVIDDADIVMERLGPPSTTDAADVEPSAHEREWTAAPGDHLWGIAERVLRDAWQRPPADHEIDGYWRRLVDDNRDRLVDPDVPDLIFPGQVFRVPAPPDASARA